MVITNNLNQASFRLRIESLRQPLEKRGVILDIHVRPRNPAPKTIAQTSRAISTR